MGPTTGEHPSSRRGRRLRQDLRTGLRILRLPSGQQLLLSRPNGQPTRAGQFYYQLAGRRAPSRRFNENQQLVREGPNDYIYLRGGAKKLVRSLQPDGEYRVTKLGRSFFRDKWTDYLAHMPVRIRGRRRSGQPYERETLLPVALDGLGRQNDSLGETATSSPPRCARWATLRTAPSSWSSRRRPIPTTPRGTGPSLSRPCRWWTIASRRRWRSTGAWACLRDVSYQLFRGSEILESAFEQREDRLCVVRQLSELSPGPRSGSSASGARRRCTSSTAAGRCSTATSRPSGSSGPWPAASTATTPSSTATPAPWPSVMRKPRDQPSYRGERRESSVPLFRDWKEWRGEIEPGHFWCQDLHVARAELLGQGHQPHVAMRGLVEWRYLRLRAKGGDCVVHEYPEDAEVLGKWMAKLDFGYRGQRLAAAASEVFASLLKARRDRGDLRELLLEQQGLCALCGTPIDAATAEADHIVPVHLRPEAGPAGFVPGVSSLQDLPGDLPRHHSGEPVLSPRAGDLRLLAGLAKCDPDRICHGVDIVRCRKNALANATFPLPVFCPLDNIRPAEEGHLADLTFVRKKEDRRAGLVGRLPYIGPGWYGKPATAFMLDTGLATWADFEWSLDATAHVSPDCLAGHWRSWRGPGPRARSTWPSSPSTLSSDSGPRTRTSSTPCARPITRWTAGAASTSRSSSTTVPLRPRLRHGARSMRPAHDFVMVLLSGMPGTGKTHLARQIVSQLSQLGEGVTLISKTHCSVQNLGLGAQTADHWVRRTIRAGRCSLDWLVVEEVTQLDVGLWADIAELSTNRRVRFLLLGDFRQLPAVQDAFGGAPVLRTLKESGVPAAARTSSRRTGAATRGSFASCST